ncbi:unnamed protein product [Arabis nemorensis]|uniref:Uncharacterized protein n=1 Tax=Arabis nemorensis TaxID=586526 RepID=A0A565CVM6_9BRAS|nr:unnamed protein product [Arabis nemorensis]
MGKITKNGVVNKRKNGVASREISESSSDEVGLSNPKPKTKKVAKKTALCQWIPSSHEPTFGDVAPDSEDVPMDTELYTGETRRHSISSAPSSSAGSSKGIIL